MTEQLNYILNQCHELQKRGKMVNFINQMQQVEIEHREKATNELIAAFTIRDINNQDMIAATNLYLSKLLAESK